MKVSFAAQTLPDHSVILAIIIPNKHALSTCYVPRSCHDCWHYKDDQPLVPAFEAPRLVEREM